MLLLAPAVGAPTQELLQDTLKSALVALMALFAALWLLWLQRRHALRLRWHPLLLIPLALGLHAATSTLWSHAYLASVEALRWIVLALVFWLGLHISPRHWYVRVIPGIVAGAVLASLWTLWQFWGELSIFPQAAAPASTFVNRNFYAEYVVCTLPFAACLLLRAGTLTGVGSAAFSLGLLVLGLCMTGTRSAMLALLPLVVCAGVACSRQRWRVHAWGVALTGLLIPVALLGSIPTGNALLQKEYGHVNALQRAAGRSATLLGADAYTKGSFAVRHGMWRSTLAMAADHPVGGVGAGAWEVHIPRYQGDEAAITEIDYYAHNEYLQLLAEYGLTGALVLALMAAYGLHALRTARRRRDDLSALRYTALASLLALLVVSAAGFPWRLACTGVMLALCLALLARTERCRWRMRVLRYGTCAMPRPTNTWALTGIALGIGLAVGLSARAVYSERVLVRAIRLAIVISHAPNPQHPTWDKDKQEVLRLARLGIALHPHYRKLSPRIADEMARWGDWDNALWIWESMLISRPHVVALLVNASRAQLHRGDLPKAQDLYLRAIAIQPRSRSVQGLQSQLVKYQKLTLSNQSISP